MPAKKYFSDEEKLAAERERKLRYKRKIRAANPEHNKEELRKRRYGITTDEYNAMFKKQKGRCKICKVHQTEIARAFHVDHNHVTGEVRGLLCHHCNVGLGHFRDDPSLLRKATKYLTD